MTTRREFLAASSAFAAATAVGATGATQPRLGFQVFAVRDLCMKDLVGTLRAARAIGYEGVETGRFYGRSDAEWKAIADLKASYSFLEVL